MTTFVWTLQVVEPAKSPEHAAEMLEGLRLQDGFIAGRVIGEGNSKPFAAQAFFEDCGPVDWLPDGMRRVMTPRRLLAWLSSTWRLINFPPQRQRQDSHGV